MIVAITILAMSLAALYRAAGGATRSVAVDEKTAYAVELARSLRDLHSVVPLEGLSAKGETDGGFAWQVAASPLDFPEEAGLPEGSLQSLRVAVTWQDGAKERRYQLASVTAGRAEPGE